MMKTMKAMALDRFGGPENLRMQEVEIPPIDAGEVLIRVGWAGVGSWDVFERQGGYSEMLGIKPKFPYVLGSEGSGSIEAVGSGVTQFRRGDRVVAVSFLNPKGGFYADFAVVNADLVFPLPATVEPAAAAAAGGVGVTALRGIDDTLGIQPGETVLISGANGGIGHVAVQIAKRRGARVLAIASGTDGVALAKQLGADWAFDGHHADLAATIRSIAPAADAALLTVGISTPLLELVKTGGRIAFPTGVRPEPALPGREIRRYNGEPDNHILRRYWQLFVESPLSIHLHDRFRLPDAPAAHEAVEKHHSGKLVLEVQSS
jgi:NADPH:quinone reductase